MTFPECRAQCSLQFIIEKGEKRKKKKERKTDFVTKGFIILLLTGLFHQKNIESSSSERRGEAGRRETIPLTSFYHRLKDFVTPTVIMGDILPINEKASEEDQ